MKFATKVR